MEKKYCEINLASWADSIIELEENSSHSEPLIFEEAPSHSALVPTMPTYYRSKAFSNSISINNLINAADPLLTLATKLRKITIPPDAAVLHQHLCHEIKAFENKAQTAGYRTQLIMAARYVLCALLDELISLTLWQEAEWKKYSLIETFHKELGEEDHFFMMLKHSLHDTAGHIDLLELIYLCLRLGYEGKYRNMERGYSELSHTTEDLYHAITQYRDECSRGLLISSEHAPSLPTRKKNYAHLLPSTWVVSVMMMLCLLTAFIFSYLKLTQMASPVNQFLNDPSSLTYSWNLAPGPERGGCCAR